MGKGRAPCCDKNQVKKGPWSPAEDMRLVSFIQKHGHQNWRALPKQAGLLRCGKSCRLRWINYLRPDVKRGNFTKEEEDAIISLHKALGNRWSTIASRLPGRTDNEIKNVWNTHLKKRLSFKNGNNSKTDDSNESSTTTISSSSFSSEIPQSRKRNSENAHDHDHKQVSMTTKKPRTMDSIQDLKSEDSNEPKETKEQKEFPTSSNNSNMTSSGQVFVSKPEELQTDPRSDYNGHAALDEVNKPEFPDIADGIQSDYDYDFWNMLDGFSSFQSNSDLHLHIPESSYSLNLNDSCNNWEVDNRMWLRYLESELELEDQ
ncbi:hypothetical protein K2173_004799 [Erythroxylum novogranatense]|uniref:Uncharacterized protein n=1 Tax=Erythroxylum novogranatense TaxID=1862640 RepID=A0AAV8SJQ0_9ROSI|nr:hypothetical protein K2173_004799 [Erythroxylum novogranatense]